jgi:hypothetical protein
MDEIACSPDNVCQEGLEGEPCASVFDCGPTAPICSPEGKCQDGTDGDPCQSETHCREDYACVDHECVP